MNNVAASVRHRRSAMLASGRFAMFDDGMGFSLVPWRPVLEKHLSQSVAGVTLGNSVSWMFGRQRGMVYDDREPLPKMQHYQAEKPHRRDGQPPISSELSHFLVT